jgi:6-phosphogluconolactonase (cycloisomerase 2 family)
MKFTKFGKALLMGALSVGVVVSLTSCVQSYSVGYLYVTGTVTAETSGSGIISGFSIDHNTGKLTAIHGLPISSGGANPDRAVLITGSRFLYVLNRGVNAAGGADCTSANPCQNANITQFAVGANGILSAQETFYTKGLNPFRLVADGSGNFLYVLDHDSIGKDGINPANATTNPNPNCALTLGNSLTTCGDITAFSINSTTGRLTTLQNTQTSANGTPLNYFPVPANPVDFVMASGNLITLSGSSSTDYPYSGGSSVFPYAYSSANGQLTISQNSPQPLTGIAAATALVYANSYVYVLDNEPLAGTSAKSQILPYSVGTGGALQAQIGGPVPDDVTLSNPIAMLVESKGKWAYVANQGNNTGTSGNAQSGLAGYVIDPNTRVLTTLPGEPFGSGAGPQCIVEDPSNQFVYEANLYDSTVTGRMLDQNSGDLNNLSQVSSFALTGPPTFCLMDGRTN